MTSSYKELKTERLQLRLIKLSDKKEIFFLRTDETVNHYIKRETLNNITDALAYIEKIEKGVIDKKWYHWCITKKGNNNVIGTISLWNFSEDRKTTEVGYDLHPDYHGNGIMSEVLETVLLFGLNELKLIRIEAYTHKENLKSLNLLEKHGFICSKLQIDENNSNNKIFILNK